MAKTKVRWDDSFYVKAHQYARSGLSDKAVADALGIPYTVFRFWVKRKDALRLALDSARSPGDPERCEALKVRGGEKYLDYVYNRLPPDLQKLWEQLNSIDANAPPRVKKKGHSAYDPNPDKIDRLFTQAGIKNARQSLWVHALVASNFNANEACRKVNVSPQAVRKWKEDPEFLELVESVEEMKDNFFEASFIDAVASGDTAARIYAAKTRLAKRGYAPPQKDKAAGTTHKGDVNVNIVTLNQDDINKMPLEDRKRMLEQIRNAREMRPALTSGENNGTAGNDRSDQAGN